MESDKSLSNGCFQVKLSPESNSSKIFLIANATATFHCEKIKEDSEQFIVQFSLLKIKQLENDHLRI